MHQKFFFKNAKNKEESLKNMPDNCEYANYEK